MTRDEMIFREAQRLAGDGGMSAKDVTNARVTVDLFWETVRSERVAKRLGHATPPREPDDAVTMTVRQLASALESMRDHGDAHEDPSDTIVEAHLSMDPHAVFTDLALAIRDHLASRAKGGG